MLRSIQILIFDDFQLLDAAGPIAAFEIAGRIAPGSYDVSVVAAEPGLVQASAGVPLLAGPFTDTPPHTLLIAGGNGTRGDGHEKSIAYIRSLEGRAQRITSVCSGAFLLAASGLLDGRMATTHWNRGPDFARKFPAVKLNADRIFTRDGPYWTSAGITAGIDMSLALIEEDLGEEVARATARQLVLPHRRAGGQSQFSVLMETQRPGGRFSSLLDWARARLTEKLGVEQLAAEACMSPRHFARAFAAEAGVTPAKAIERLRVEAAQTLVETGGQTLDRIAQQTGFDDPERMRRAFVRTFGHPPQALRRAAKSAA
ncbi:MAG: GlxA family transcriptional regulator [Caulobacteraceae bacterium]